MRTAPLYLTVAVVVVTATGCESFTDVLAPVHYLGTLEGAKVKPTAVETNATGTLTAALNQSDLMLAYTLSWQGLPDATVSAHLHGPADANGVADVLVDFDAPPAGGTGDVPSQATGSATGVIDLKRQVTATVSGDSLRTLLDAGRVYVDVHTAARPDGEIRAQVIRTN